MLPATISPLELRPRLRAPKLADRLIAELSDQIRTGVFKPGDRLPTEYQIMREQGVSRAVVREAITRLQAAGLVQARQGIGTFVLEQAQAGNFSFDANAVLTTQDVLDLLELRLGFECDAAALAAQRHSAEQLNVIQARLKQITAEPHDGADLEKPAAELHRAIVAAAGNRYYAELLSQLNLVLKQRAPMDLSSSSSFKSAEYRERTNGEYREIASAIAQRDAEGARLAMRAHLSRNRDQLLELQAG